MPDNIKALIVVLALAVPAFYVGRQLAASVVAPREFVIWRNMWFAVTIAAFLSGNFLVFAAIETIICIYALAMRAATPAVFVVLLLAVPLVDIPIAGFGAFNLLFDINNARLLTIVLLLPIMLATGGSGRRKGGLYSIPDYLIIGYVLLLIALKAENITQLMRSVVLYSLDVLIPYFAFSRMVTSLADLRKVLLAFIVAALPMSLIALFETAKGWLLYGSIIQDWGVMTTRYLLRADILRPNASAAGSIVLGFIIMIAIGCLLAVRQSNGSRRYSGIALAILGAGLFASVSRGPWVGTMVLVLVYLASSPNPISNLIRSSVVGVVVLLPLLLTPVGTRLLDLLPFIGSIEEGSVTYRQRLFDQAILVVERYPWFGSTDFRLTPEMQEMLQGEHIVDIVNTYLEIALNYGLVGLGLFLGFFATILIGLRRVLKFKVVQKTDLDICARVSMATLVAIMVTIGTVSSIDYVPYVYWSFAGLCVALIRIAYQERAAVLRTANSIGASI